MKIEENIKYWKQALELFEINFSLNQKESHSNDLKNILIKFIGLTLLSVVLLVSYSQYEIIDNFSFSFFILIIIFSMLFVVSLFVVVFSIILMSEILDYLSF